VRVAIYAAPGFGTADAGALALRRTAERWLGRSLAGEDVEPDAPAGWTRADVDAITVDARRYGFHGTLKAPFRLIDGRSLDELDDLVHAFARCRDAVAIPELTLARLGGFFALIPGAASPALQSLAADIVTTFDPFRAPMTEAELARRGPDELPPHQRELLRAWGYPYVLDEFRFHLTLTDRIPTERRDEVEAVLAGRFGATTGGDLALDALAICTEAEPGAPFALHSIHPLRTTAAAPQHHPAPERTA
jgi:putative phosphonate metabolism protein